jgi:hypothetical protein
VQEAANIDKKIDDGYPTSGAVLAMELNVGFGFAGVAWMNGWYYGRPLNAMPTAPTPTSCFDNNNSPTGAPMLYTFSQNGGAGMNCALSFLFQ